MREYKYKIEADYEQYEVRFGKWSMNVHSGMRKVDKHYLQRFCLSVARANGVDVFHATKKDLYKDFTEKFDIRPRVLYDIVCKLRLKVLCHKVDIKTLWDCYGTRSLSIPSDFKSALPLLEQCVKDGQRNIAPIVAHTRLSPHDLKLWMGKGNWKRVCSNSLSYNREWSHVARSLLASTTLRHADDGSITGYTDDHKKLVSMFLDIPYSTLRHRLLFNITLALRDINFGKLIKENKIACNKEKIKDAWQTIIDTCRMLTKLGREYNPNWSLKRWVEEHDRASEEITRLEDLADTVDFREEHLAIPESAYHVLPLDFEAGSYGKATLLTSRKALREEGSKMKHCVAGYADWCKQGEYAVYSITDKDGKCSTLGLHLYTGPRILWTTVVRADGTTAEIDNPPGDTPRGPAWEIQQHQGYNNRTPLTFEQVRIKDELLAHIKSKEKERDDKSS